MSNPKNREESIWKDPGIKLFAEISHDFKTPISIIYSSIQLMDNYENTLDGHDYKEKAVHYMNLIRQNCFRIMRMTNNLIDLSCYSSGVLKCKSINYDIVKLIKDISQSVQVHVETKGVELVFETSLDSMVMAVDPDMIERVILNLVSNSLKFMEQKGVISIFVSESEGDILITVKDTGVGICKESLASIFDLFSKADNFYNRHNEGCGMGLYIVKVFVEAHGGNVKVSSEIGKGTEFEIRLPKKVLGDDGVVYVDIQDNKSRISASGVTEPVNVELSDVYPCTYYERKND